MLHVPQFLEAPLASVARNLAKKLPRKSITNRELYFFLGASLVSPLHEFVPADRDTSSEIAFLPPMPVGGRRFLCLTTVHPAIRQVITKLDDVTELLVQRFQTQALSDSEYTLIRRVTAGLLARGYAQGIRVILSRYVPALFDLPRDRPCLTLPCVLVSFADRRLGIQVVNSAHRVSLLHSESIGAA